MEMPALHFPGAEVSHVSCSRRVARPIDGIIRVGIPTVPTSVNHRDKMSAAAAREATGAAAEKALPDATAILEARKKVIGFNVAVNYSKLPLYIVKGKGQFLYDEVSRPRASIESDGRPPAGAAPRHCPGCEDAFIFTPVLAVAPASASAA